MDNSDLTLVLDETCTVSKENRIVLPDLNSRFLVPRYLSFHQIIKVEGNELEFPHDSNISCTVKSGIFNQTYSKAYFQINDIVDLFELANPKELASKITLNLKPENRNSITSTNISVRIGYVKYSGHMLWQESHVIPDERDRFSFTLDNLKNITGINRIVLKSNLPILDVTLVPECRKLGGSEEWLDDLKFTDDDPTCHQIDLDMSDDELSNYCKFIDFMKFEVHFNADDNKDKNSKIQHESLHVLVYGI